MAATEYRCTSELRAEGDGLTLVGYAATFNTPTEILDFTEVIAPGAFTRALAEKQDVVMVFNHALKNDTVLGRTSSGTLTLAQDNKGLCFRCVLDPNQQSHRDLYSSVARQDIAACSFCFCPHGDTGETWSRTKDGRQLRTLKDVDLMDASIVTRPAYLGTSVQARDSEALLFANKLFGIDAESEQRRAQLRRRLEMESIF